MSDIDLSVFTEKKILKHLSKDPVLEMLILNLDLKTRPEPTSLYEALLRAINFQQLSGKAASTIHNRFLDLFEDRYPSPEILIEMEDDDIRAAGLSRQKAMYVKNVAHFFIQNQLMDIKWEQKSDKEIIELLTQIKGVGHWTVEMLLIFTLKRPDVLPLDDLVVKQSMIELYEVDTEKLKGKALNNHLLKIAEPWQPYRTTASLYLWNAKDTTLA